MSNDYIHQIIGVVKTAIEQISSDYFKIATTYKKSGIVRERVFCYELYYQIRKITDDETSQIDFNSVLNGEIDKRGHIEFAEKDRKNPDFVFHTQGTFEDNNVVIEVKGKLNKAGIKKDFLTLLTFVSKYNYKAGIFILYNHSFEQLIKTIGNEINEFSNNQYSNQIMIITIETPKSECKIYSLFDIRTAS